jgi:GNAT superfamily N-acetyltransferase
LLLYLLTLTAEEIELVHQGVSLYAKGLKTLRLQNKGSTAPEEMAKKSNENLLEILNQLAQIGFALKPFSQEDEAVLYDIFRDVVDSGSQFPYECHSAQEFYRQFLAPISHVYVCHSPTKEVVGGFYIRPNFSGRSSHIANAAYMIKGSYRGQGIGTLLVNASLEIAKDLGFQAMQFNMVLSQNVIAINLYQKLGFNIIGTIPQAIRNPDGSYQERYILHRKLTV